MWGRLANLASAVTGNDDDEEPGSDDTSMSRMEFGGSLGGASEMSDADLRLLEQEKMIIQLKEMIRDREKNLADKDDALKRLNAELGKVKLRAKSKVASLTSQLNQSQKSASEVLEKASVGSDESVNTLASESTSSVVDQTSRARQRLLRKQLADKDRLLVDKEAQLALLRGQLDTKDRIIVEMDQAANQIKSKLSDVELALSKQEASSQQLQEALHEASGGASDQDLTTKSQLQIRLEEMLAQMMHKDSRIVELDAEITQLHQTVIDLRENVAEKDEVIRSRDQAVQIIQGTLAERTAERDRLQVSETSNRGESGAMQEVLDSLQQRLLETNEQIRTRDKTIELIKSECQKKEQQVTELMEQLVSFQSSESSLKQSYSILVNSHSELERTHGMVLQSHRAIEDRCITAERRLADLEQRHSVLQCNYSDLDRANTALQTRHVELERRLAALDASHQELSRSRAELEQRHTALEQNYMQLQMAHIEQKDQLAALESTDQTERSEMTRKYSDLLQQHDALQSRCSELEQTLALTQPKLPESLADVGDEESAKRFLTGNEDLVKKLQQDVEATEARFSKFKALAGSKIKALEKDLEEAKQRAGESAALQNHIAELEEEKGNLQLQLLEFEENSKQGSELNGSRISQLEQRCVDLEKQIEILQNGNKTISQQLTEEFAMELSTEKQKNSGLMEELTSKEQTISNLNAEIASLREQLTEDYENKNKLISQLNVDIEDRSRVIEQLTKQLSEHERNEAVRTSQAVEETSTVSRLKDEIADKARCIEELRMKLDQTTESHNVKTQNAEELLQKTLLELKAKDENAMRVESELAAKTELIQSVSAKLDLKNSEVSDLELKMQQLESELQQAVEQQNKSATLQADLQSGFKLEVDRLRAENEALLTRISGLESESSQLMASLEMYANENQEMKKTLEKDHVQQSIIDRLEKQIADDLATITCLKEQNQSLSAELNSNLQELDRQKLLQGDSFEASSVLHNALADKDAKLQQLQRQLDEKEEEIRRKNCELDAAREAEKLSAEAVQIAMENAERRCAEVQQISSVKLKQIDELLGQIDGLQQQLKTVEENSESQRNRFSNKESELVGTIESLQSQLHITGESVVLLQNQLHDEHQSCETLKKKLALSEAKISSLSENLQEEEAQLIEITQELEKWKDSFDQLQTEKQTLLAAKDEELLKLTEKSQEADVQMKKYMAIIKKLKEKLQEEKAKVRDVESFVSEAHNTSMAESTAKLETSRLELEGAKELTSHLQSRIDDLSEQLAEKVRQLNDANESHETAVKNHSQALKEVTDRYEEADAKLKNIESQRIQELSAAGDQQTTLESLYQSERKSLENSLEESTRIVSQLKSQIDALHEEKSAMLGDVGKRNQELADCKLQLQEVMAELDHWKLLVETANCDRAQLEEKLETVVAMSRKESLQLKYDLDKAQSDIAELNSVVNKQKADIALSDEAVTKYSYDLKCHQDKLLSLNDENSRLSVESQHARLEMEGLLEDLKRFSAENELLKLNNVELMEELDRLKVEREEYEISQQNWLQQQQVIQDSADQEVQLQVEMNQKSPSEAHQKQDEDYSRLDDEKKRLEVEKETLIKELEECKNVNHNVHKENENLATEISKCNGLMATLEEKNTMLENRLRDLGQKHENTLSSFEQIRKNSESDRQRVELEFRKASERAQKAENAVHQLKAELEVERERFHLRESELEGSSEELQLEVARLSQSIEQMEEDEQRLLMELEKAKNEIVHFSSAKESIVEMTKEECHKIERELKNQIDQLNGEIERYRLETERLERDLKYSEESSVRKSAELTRQYEMLATDISTYQDLVEDLRAKNSHLEQNLKQLSTTHNSLTVQMESFEAERLLLLQDRQRYEEVLEVAQNREGLLLKENEELKWKLSEFNSTEEELEETQNRLFELQTENADLKRKVIDLDRSVNDLSAVEAESTSLQERYLAVLQDNNALIRQSEEMYQRLRSSGVVSESLQTNRPGSGTANASAASSEPETVSAMKEMQQLKAELLTVKEKHHNELALKTEAVSRLEGELVRAQKEIELLRAESRRHSDVAKDFESLRSEYKDLQSRHEQSLAKLSAVRTKNGADQSSYVARLQTRMSADDDDRPKVHSSMTHSSSSYTSDDKETELAALQSELAEMRKQREEQSEKLNKVEQLVQLRERDLAHVHQQYQILYQQFAALQMHYAALEQKLQAGQVVQQDDRTIAETQSTAAAAAATVATLTSRLQELERQLKDKFGENEILQQQLSAETQNRLQFEELLKQATEQLQIREQMSTHSVESERAIVDMNDEDEKDGSRLRSFTAGLRDIRNIHHCYQFARHWCETNSVLLGRTLRGQPRLRKSFLAYVFLLHVYVLFACVLSATT